MVVLLVLVVVLVLDLDLDLVLVVQVLQGQVVQVLQGQRLTNSITLLSCFWTSWIWIWFAFSYNALNERINLRYTLA